MKPRLLILFILLMGAVFSCRSSKKNGNPSGEISDNSPENQGPKGSLKGTVTLTRSYCGGAAPSAEMLERMRTPVMYEGKTFYIRKGSVNDLKKPVLDSVKTNAQGEFLIELPAGDYVLLLPEQKDSSFVRQWRKNMHIQISDEACLKTWFSKGYRTLSIAEGTPTELKIEIHRSCFIPEGVQCLNYIGPYPP